MTTSYFAQQTQALHTLLTLPSNYSFESEKGNPFRLQDEPQVVEALKQLMLAGFRLEADYEDRRKGRDVVDLDMTEPAELEEILGYANFHEIMIIQPGFQKVA